MSVNDVFLGNFRCLFRDTYKTHLMYSRRWKCWIFKC